MLLLAGALAAFAVMTFGGLAHPLLWQDEGETTMFASRVLEYGYPKVHGDRNVVYEFGPDIALGVKESVDAYIGKTWGDFYFAVPGLVWAAGSDDPYERTFRLRLPFALAGSAGLALLLLAVLPAVPRPRRVAFAAAFVALASVSISLVLHLREVRYYALLVLALGGLLALHLRAERTASDRWVAAALAQAAVSFLLFQVFHVAWFAATGLLAVDALRRAWAGPLTDRPRRVAIALAPHLLAGLAVAPWLIFLETFQVARGFASHVGVSPAGYLGNVGQVLAHFARHELLLPALVLRIAACWRGLAVPIAGRLTLFVVAYALAGCINPLVYERYFVVLGPLVTLVFLLDAFALVEHARGDRRVVAALVAGVLLALVPRTGAVTGRLAELREPVRGPVDFAVAHLRERYPDTSRLVVATNYDAHPLMYYLDSHVIVGLSRNNILVERELRPDVVIPRARWPRTLPELQRFLARGDYREERLPVRDTHFNNVPALSASPAIPDPHRFRTAEAPPGQGLRVHHRVR